MDFNLLFYILFLGGFKLKNDTNVQVVKNTKNRIAKFISVITVVPVVAFFTVTLLYFNYKDDFKSIAWYIYSIMFLTILPLTAYPLKRILPKFKDKGRDGERKLAFILAVIGYVAGCIFAIILKAPSIVQKTFLAYVSSGGVLAFVNKVLKFKASGHACGFSGPVTLLYYFFGSSVLWIFLFLPLIFWARLNLKRHTIKELFVGTLIGIFSTAIVLHL